MKKKSLLILLITFIFIFFTSCNLKKIDISGVWNGSVKFKTEIPFDYENPNSETAGIMITTQSRELEFSTEAEGTFKNKIVQKIDSISFENEIPDYFDENELRENVDYDIEVVGNYELYKDSVEFIPKKISINGSEFVDYDVELSENGLLFDFVINGRKSAIYPNNDGILYIDGIQYKKNEL